MRCIFCKSNSASSRGIEHIIPESLGNAEHVLPRGIVCDGCNNYFARKVEKPFLDSSALRHLRFYQGVPNKRGRIPMPEVIGTPPVGSIASRTHDNNATGEDLPSGTIDEIARRGWGLTSAGFMPDDTITSRFLAKVALEAMAQRVASQPEMLTELCDKAELNDLRDHARRGYTTRWPVHVRSIYPARAATFGTDDQLEQIVHEWDFLLTGSNEWYFVIAIFGVEFTINLGGPDVGSYLQWLKEHADVSPLYSTKNGGLDAMPR